jgi:maltooligosyltrehalose trehalohydrolase
VSSTGRRYPVGAEVLHPDTVNLRVWAPDHHRVDAVIDGQQWPMHGEADDYWQITAPAPAGARYGFILDGDATPLPDPASRSQPDGVEALSAIWDPAAYPWRDHGWTGISLPGPVLYELHVGTFTAEGTFRGAARQLGRLRELGITAVQMMPVNAFAGRFGWGYDGVFWTAPHAAYGPPEDLQHFVDEAHRLGVAVILDVVFNHLGPAGNVLPRFSRHYLSTRHTSEWGDALNADGELAHGLRSLIIATAEYWVREFHVDGLRLDAVHAIIDDSPTHIVAALTAAARAAAAPRRIVVVAEHEPQHARLMRAPAEGGHGLDGVYTEDFHHSTRVALTGVREAYLSDYQGTSREWLSAAQHGFLFQGQRYPWQRQPRGAPALDITPDRFLAFLENHDQVANITGGRLRAQTSPAWWRAMSALLLLGPWTPLLFQGQEWGAQNPFLYFCDHAAELQDAVRRGRREFLKQFSRHDPLDQHGGMPIDHSAFESSRLHHPPDLDAVPEWRLYRDALRWRTRLLLAERPVRGSTLGNRTLLLRPAPIAGGRDALMVVNLGPDRRLEALPDPLVAPPDAGPWIRAWCTEERQYGGFGVARSDESFALIATGHATTLFLAETLT